MNDDVAGRINRRADKILQERARRAKAEADNRAARAAQPRAVPEDPYGHYQKLGRRFAAWARANRVPTDWSTGGLFRRERGWVLRLVVSRIYTELDAASDNDMFKGPRTIRQVGETIREVHARVTVLTTGEMRGNLSDFPYTDLLEQIAARVARVKERRRRGYVPFS